MLDFCPFIEQLSLIYYNKKMMKKRTRLFMRRKKQVKTEWYDFDKRDERSKRELE